MIAKKVKVIVLKITTSKFTGFDLFVNLVYRDCNPKVVRVQK